MSPLSSDTVVLLSLSMFFLVFCLIFGVMLSPCCRSARSSRGYTVGLLLCSSDTCMLQLSLLSILPSVTATQGCSWGSLLQLDFVVVQFSKPLDDSCHVLQWVFLLQWDLAIFSHLFCHRHRDDACCIADRDGCCIFGLSLSRPLCRLVTAVIRLLWWRAPCVCVLFWPPPSVW